MSNPGKLDRTWDSFDAYLFDIDGTLIECTDATHYFAFCNALKVASGRDLTLEGVTAHGNTDVGILRDALTRAGIAESEWRPKVATLCDAISDFVEQRKGELCTRVLPQVRDVLDHLHRRGAKLAVATGNLRRIGTLKLQRAGLLEYFHFGGWSDSYEHRADVFRGAIEIARQRYGNACSLCVVGDTPADVRAAHENGMQVIAVATGIYSFDDLMRESPELCVRSMRELMDRV